MKVEIIIFDYKEYSIYKKLIKELEDKGAIDNKKDRFTKELDLNVKSFDEIIYLLEKYNNKIEIKLSIYPTEVCVYISRYRESCDLGNQVD